MLGHLRTKTLDAFKDAFEKALARGDGFAVASRECTEAFLAKFDKGCEGMYVSFTNLIAFKVKSGALFITCFHLTENTCVLPHKKIKQYRGPDIKLANLSKKPMKLVKSVSAVYII
jgi:Root hair defective 3 GTP-binding protein (RHD3)